MNVWLVRQQGRENGVLPDLIPPSRSLACTKIRIIYETIKPSCLYFHQPIPLMPASRHRLLTYASQTCSHIFFTAEALSHPTVPTDIPIREAISALRHPSSRLRRKTCLRLPFNDLTALRMRDSSSLYSIALCGSS